MNQICIKNNKETPYLGDIVLIYQVGHFQPIGYILRLNEKSYRRVHTGYNSWQVNQICFFPSKYPLSSYSSIAQYDKCHETNSLKIGRYSGQDIFCTIQHIKKTGLGNYYVDETAKFKFKPMEMGVFYHQFPDLFTEISEISEVTQISGIDLMDGVALEADKKAFYIEYSWSGATKRKLIIL